MMRRCTSSGHDVFGVFVIIADAPRRVEWNANV